MRIARINREFSLTTAQRPAESRKQKTETREPRKGAKGAKTIGQNGRRESGQGETRGEAV
jgi:hypothetical protein